MDRDKIIEAVKGNRINCIYPMKRCPFSRECEESCELIFEGYKKRILYGNDFRNDQCPCDLYKKGYVKRRMKQLFPELYEDPK